MEARQRKHKCVNADIRKCPCMALSVIDSGSGDAHMAVYHTILLKIVAFHAGGI